jgi:hypothetical protein
VETSGVARTAQRTIRNNATSGIFRISINQMKVQASTGSIVYRPRHPYNPAGARQAPPLTSPVLVRRRR